MGPGCGSGGRRASVGLPVLASGSLRRSLWPVPHQPRQRTQLSGSPLDAGLHPLPRALGASDRRAGLPRHPAEPPSALAPDDEPPVLLQRKDPARSPSTEIADTQGSTPRRLKARRRSAAGRTPERVDQYRRVQARAATWLYRTNGSTRAHRVATPLRANPRCRIFIPVVPGVGDRPQGPLDLIPAPFILETAPYQSGNERTATPGPGPSIKILDKIIVQLNVQSHVFNNTHIAGESPLRRDVKACDAEVQGAVDDEAAGPVDV